MDQVNSFYAFPQRALYSISQVFMTSAGKPVLFYIQHDLNNNLRDDLTTRVKVRWPVSQAQSFD